MSEYKLCPNGHYYQGDHCPHCNGKSGVKISDLTTWTPISEYADELRKQTNIILRFDTAPDGIARFVSIERKHGDLFIKGDVARMIGCDEDDVPAAIEGNILNIDELVDNELLKKNIYTINTPDATLNGDYYVSENSISFITPDTLLTQILGRGSKLDLLYREKPVTFFNRSEVACQTEALSSMSDEEFQEARKEIESKKFLSISLNDNKKQVLCIPDRTNVTGIKSVEDFISEDVSIFCPKIVLKEYNKPDVEFDIGTEIYADYLADIANNHRKTLYYRVSRHKVAMVLSTLVGQLSELHKKDLVHCDLKPQNILCLKDGLVPFDGINVRNGEISAGMTTNYCAPEQILTMPVSPATDVYNMGLMVLSVIDGIVYGKTSSYIIPTGGVAVKEVKLLTDPMVYIDYESSNIRDKEGIVFWRLFLEKCLAFDTKNRFPDMESFFNEYSRLLDRYPLKNDIDFTPNFGRLSLANIQGKFKAAWFIETE